MSIALETQQGYIESAVENGGGTGESYVAHCIAAFNEDVRYTTGVDAHHEDVQHCGVAANGDVMFETVR